MRRLICLVAILMILTSLNAYAADPFYNFIFYNHQRAAIPLTYSTEQILKGFADDNSTLEFATDIFIDGKDNLYILDNGNDRVLKYKLGGGKTAFDKAYSLIGELQTRNPNGIFVDDDGDIYIADTDNYRVLHMGENGNFIEEFVQPTSELYDENSPFRPYKIGIDSLGQLYILNYEDDNGFIILDAYNQFKGYTAPAKVGADTLSEKLRKMFFSQEQKDKLGKKNRPMHSNLTFAKDNTFYVTTARARNAQLKRYTSVGENIFNKKDDFSIGTVNSYDMGSTSGNRAEFIDVCVDADGNASVLDNATGYIMQYSADGNMLTVFGGKGGWAGRFMNPVAIAEDSTGRIYVLDKDTSTIQVFKPTKFIQSVHEALKLYNDGQYEKSYKPWQELLKITNVYPVANMGMGKSYMKQEKWLDAMMAYKKNGDKDSYSEAFDQLRLQFVRQYFGWVVLAIISFIVLSVFGIYKLRKYAIKIGGGR